ncbi:heme o synthase [Blochmannia endosymbiont of Camponotus sp. C-003]|uniref:heme o synthase n=1 Tax=unclassified Candidatus Blochmanniella TaxID=711328 RepID=UPI002025789C|nr:MULTISPECIES: heme o synthase [unclassified Candidatus Blochmannia]URJ23565.1 heme o synthase [Blochmannia endosymbiont of Camponotus sp. C-003]URJ29036.1 heme o synthase [Blochmannia endosymbiont of Camponotus sp. C-046]
MMKYYFHLIKPGIVVGNIMSSIGGFLIASRKHVSYPLFIPMIIGIALIIAASCVLNNIIDRDIDAVMERTKHRVLVKYNQLFLNKSILYAVILSISGFLFLGFTRNFLTVFLAAIGLFIYVGVYSLWMKRRSIYSVIVGSISGAMPPIIGYCTVANQFDVGALILLIMFSLWQVPHSYAISILRLHDYKVAFIPTFPIQKGVESTKNHMVVYIIGFIVANIVFTAMGYTSYMFLIIISIMNAWWLYVGLYGYKIINNDSLWAKKMFFLSLVVIVSLNLLLSLDGILFAT